MTAGKVSNNSMVAKKKAGSAKVKPKTVTTNAGAKTSAPSKAAPAKSAPAKTTTGKTTTGKTTTGKMVQTKNAPAKAATAKHAPAKQVQTTKVQSTKVQTEKVQAKPSQVVKQAPAKKAPVKVVAPAKSPAPVRPPKDPSPAVKVAVAKSTPAVSPPAKPKAVPAPAVVPATPPAAQSVKDEPAVPAAKKAPVKPVKPVKIVNPFDAKFLEEQRTLLIKERVVLLGSADRLQAEADSLMEDLDPGDVQFDDESGEGDSLVVERERDLALSAQARQMVTEIDAALIRIGEGTYGMSVISGRPIPRERLKAIPWATELVEEKVGGLGRR
jgi:RNA polymerase-binding transcription factor DksA